MATDDGLIKIFYEIDTDKSGVVDAGELRRYMRSKNYHDSFVQKYLNIFDRNQDGKISFEEYRQGLKKIPHNQHLYNEWKCLFDRLDRDNNGYITINEVRTMIAEASSSEKFRMGELEDFMRKTDKNGDGMLNYNEFLQFITDRDC